MALVALIALETAVLTLKRVFLISFWLLVFPNSKKTGEKNIWIFFGGETEGLCWVTEPLPCTSFGGKLCLFVHAWLQEHDTCGT